MGVPPHCLVIVIVIVIVIVKPYTWYIVAVFITFINNRQ